MIDEKDPHLGRSDEDSNAPGERTALAEDRTILANERMFAAWMRTSLACIAIGVGFHALFSRVDPDWLPRGIATAFVLLGMLVIVLAERRATAVIGKVDAHVVRTARRMNLRLFTVIVCLGATGLLAAVWLMKPN
jgi:putative membrane protein